MPGGFDDLLEEVAWEDNVDVDCSTTLGGGGGAGKPDSDDVVELRAFGASACLRWLWILS